MNKPFFFPLMGLLIVSLFLLHCSPIDNEALPIIGNHPDPDNGIYHTIPDFSFVNQDSASVTNETFKDKIYIVDFFFTSCPTICPKVKKNMLRIYDKFSDEERLALLSHSIDTKYDTVATLKRYADKLEISSDRWHLVTGEHEAIYGIADDYVSIAMEAPDAPGGFDHSGRLILIDKDRRIRSFCDGTDADSVTGFMKDIEKLLHEMDSPD